MSEDPKPAMTLDPEMLAAYIDKRLTPEQRAAVEAQLASDPDSYAVLVESMKALDALDVEPRTMPFVAKSKPVMKRWTIAAGVLAAAGALILVVMQPDWLQRLRGDAVDPRIARLATAAGTDRSIEARLTGFKYAPLAPVNRGAQPQPASNLALVAAAAELQQAAARNPDAANLHAWGVAQLLLGQLDGAIGSLSTAAALSSDRAILSDLAAAYVTRAATTNQAADWPQALAFASRAVEGTQSPLREALFNRALAAEALKLNDVAEKYWNDYLASETHTEWRAEATKHLDRLKAPPPQSWMQQKTLLLDAAARGDADRLDELATGNAQKTRELVEDELLPAWAREEAEGAPASNATLSTASRVADALARVTQDDLLARSLGIIETADRTHRLRLAAAVQQYAAGRSLYEKAAMQDSVAPFDSARTAFERDGVPLVEWCDLYLATAAYYRADYPRTLEITDASLVRTRKESWSALRGRVYWLQGLVAVQRAEYDRSLSSYTIALELFEKLRESENAAAIHSLLATAFLYVGDDDSMWFHTVRALQSTSAESAYRRQHMILVGAANRAARFDLPEAALTFADQAAAVNQRWRDAVAGVEIANYRARALLQLERPADATAAVVAARQSLASITDKGLRERAEAEVLQSEADILAAADPRAGIDAAGRAIQYFDSRKIPLRVPRLYATRAAARRRIGDLDGAVADLRDGAASFDRERQTLPRSERLRLAYSDEVWGTYRALVGAEIARSSPCPAVLAAAERARAATFNLPASESSAGDAALNADPKAATVSFSFFDDRLAIIVLRHGRCELRISELDQTSARNSVAAFRSELQSADSSSASRSASGVTLYRQLIDPVAAELDGVNRVEIIADGPLHYLPFAALPEPGGTRLIERMAIRMIPNLALTATPASTSHTAIVSSGGAVAALNLPRLPGVDSELSNVTSSMTALHVTTRRAETAASFVDGLREAEVVHFAGHAIVNEQYPLLSRLILAGSSGDEWITSERLGTIGPISPRLVFLSACSTQAGRLFGGEGPASLARSFLAAGAHEVVASLWPVADDNTPALVGSFYNFWSQHGDAALALRAAIVDGLHNGTTSPRQWAAWIVIGRANNWRPPLPPVTN